MTQLGRLAFWMAGLLMVAFATDVLAGSFFRAAYLSDVAQALLLALSCGFFVAGLLFVEAKEKSGGTSFTNGEEETR